MVENLKNSTALCQSVCDILRKLMDECHIKEAELARQTGLPQTTINRLLLGGTSDPRANTLKPIADYFNVTIGQLCGFEPLSMHRLAGTTSPIKRTSWSSIPVIEWENVKSWLFDRTKITPLNHSDWIITERLLSEDSFALRSLSSMEPRFRKGSVLLVDSKLQPKDGHFVVIALDNYQPTVRKISIDGGESWLKPFDQTQPSIQLNKKHHIYGTIVESRLDIYP